MPRAASCSARSTRVHALSGPAWPHASASRNPRWSAADATRGVPTGCWSFKLSGTGGAVVLSNLLWPGFTGYASLGSASYGYCYFGNGLKNADIAFML